MPSKRFEFRDGKSSKFWEVGVKGSSVTVRFGKIGTDGQVALKEFPSAAEAKAHADKVTAEKLRKGYAPAAGASKSGSKAGSKAGAKPVAKSAAGKARAVKPAPARGRGRAKPVASPSKSPARRAKAAAGFKVTHQVDQRLTLDLSRVTQDDADSARELHREPDISVSDESFPGEMTWRIGSSSERRAPGKKAALVLQRTILFTFTWSNARAMSAWAERNVTPDDRLLPSHVAGDFEGVFVGDQMMDYETDYLGPGA